MVIISRVYWTKEEEKILIKMYANSPMEDILKALPRFDDTRIRTKANRLGLKRKIKEKRKSSGNQRRWSKKETEELKEIYSTTTNDDLIKIFSDFNLSEIRRKARSLKLEKTKETELKDTESKIKKSLGESIWSNKEEQILIDNYPQFGLNKVSELLPHRTKEAIKTKVIRLGLKRDDSYWEITDLKYKKDNVFSINITYERR